MVEKIQLFRNNLKAKKWVERFFIIAISALFSLYLFVFCAFGGRPKLFLLSYPIIGLLFLLSLLFLFLWFEKVKRNISWSLLIPLVFALIVFFTTLIGTRNFSYFKTISLLVITFYISFVCYACIGNLKIVLYLIVLPIFVFSTYYFIHYFSEIAHYSGQRLGSFFGNENDVGINLYFGFVLAAILVISFKQYWMTPLGLFILFISITTGSKKVIILSFLFLILLVFILFGKNKIVSIALIGTIVILLILFFALPAFESIRIRLFSGIFIFSSNKVDASSINRLLFFKSSFYLGSRSLLFGYGGSAFAKMSGFNAYSHNNLGEILCDFGIFGVISFYISYPIIGFFTNKKNNAHTLVNYSFLMTFIFCSFTAIFFDTKIYYVLFALSFFLNSNNMKCIKSASLKRNTYCEINI